MGVRNLMKQRLRYLTVALCLSLFLAGVVWAATNCAITGTVQNIDGSNCANCTVTFNSQVTQVLNGVTYQPLITSTTTDSSGNLTQITLPQGLAVQIQVSENGQTFAPYSAIVPFLSTVTFDELNQGILTDPLNVLASLQPPTGPLNMNDQQIVNLACPTGSTDALVWGCNATVANLTVNGSFTQNTSGLAITGLLTVSQVSDPSAPAVTAIGTTGTTHYTYFIACHDGNGGTTNFSNGTNIINSNATLSGSNYNQVAFTIPAGAKTCDVLRANGTGAPSPTGSAVGGTNLTSSPFDDTNNATNSYTNPTRNTTGDGHFAGAVTAGGVPNGIATGDMGASESAGAGRIFFGTDGAQSLDYGITSGLDFTFTGGLLDVATGGISSGTPTTGIGSGDISASRSGSSAKYWFGSNGNQSLDFGLTTGSTFTFNGGEVAAPDNLVLGAAGGTSGNLELTNTSAAVANIGVSSTGVLDLGATSVIAGHVNSILGTGSPPTTACSGGSITAGGTDNAFQETGATITGGCLVSFGTAFANAPICACNDNSAADGVRVVATTAGVTISGTSTDSVSCICLGK
jgi:hypothetical protein